MSKPKRDTKTTRRADKSRQKTAYRVSHWAEYKASLVQRGSIRLGIDEEVLASWQPVVAGRRTRGGQPKYSERAMECRLTVQAVFHRPYRQTEGFGQSLMELRAVSVPLPDDTTLCLRSADLKGALSPSQVQGAKHSVVDSTGWKVRQQGVSKRRTWRQLPRSVTEATPSLEAVVLTEASVDDAEAGGDRLDETGDAPEQVSGDGAYDQRQF